MIDDIKLGIIRRDIEMRANGTDTVLWIARTAHLLAEIDRLRSLLGQRCEECGNWERENQYPNGEAQCLLGPSWLRIATASDDVTWLVTLLSGGAGCDNYKRMET